MCTAFENSDLDQLASQEANSSGSALFVFQYVNLYTVDPIYRGAWGPSSATAIYPDRDISWGGSLLRRR